MIFRWIGAVLVVLGCGSFGFSMAADYRRQEILLGQLRRGIQCMQWELQYRLTALPELCAMGGREAGGTVGQVLGTVARRLREQVYPDVSDCMSQTLGEVQNLPRQEKHLLRRLGSTLGRYDLPGQLEGLQELSELCRQESGRLAGGRRERLKSYETLSICAGAALAILLL